jgi:hypothetical protein
VTTEIPDHLTSTFATSSADMNDLRRKAFPLYSKPHERFVLIQITDRRWVVAELASRGVELTYPVNEARPYMATYGYRVVTRPLPRETARKVLTFLMARAAQLIKVLPADVQDIVSRGPGF